MCLTVANSKNASGVASIYFLVKTKTRDVNFDRFSRFFNDKKSDGFGLSSSPTDESHIDSINARNYLRHSDWSSAKSKWRWVFSEPRISNKRKWSRGGKNQMKKFKWNRSKSFQELKFYQHTRLVIPYFLKFLWNFMVFCAVFIFQKSSKILKISF